jgi:adenine-specific DNA-methyltransferase
MDYIGSKERWNDWIFKHIKNKTKNLNQYIFIDGCAGSGSSSKYALKQKMNLISNDLLYFSSIVVRGCVLKDRNQLNILSYHINKINNLSGVKGFFFNNFSEEASRLYFSKDNAMKIDACREYILNLSDEQIKDSLLYFSLEALSRVSNTTGVHGAFLKKLKERALQPFKLKIEEMINTKKKVIAYSEDISILLTKLKIKKSILYIDPPYTSRQYPPNYHLYETFVRNDNPSLTGKTGLRKNWMIEGKSSFCNKQHMLNYLNQIIINHPNNLFYLSYSSDGLASKEEIIQILSNFGKVKHYSIISNRYKADISNKREYNTTPLYEWLFELEKGKF